MAESKIQWHPGFYAGMELEFSAYQVTMQQEFQLTRGPLSIDLLKSPDDEMSIDVFYKTQAYACLYKASGESVNEITDDEITVTLCRDTYPQELMHQLEVSGFELTMQFPGVYYLSGKGLFPTQIIVSGELESEEHAVLRIMPAWSLSSAHTRSPYSELRTVPGNLQGGTEHVPGTGRNHERYAGSKAC